MRKKVNNTDQLSFESLMVINPFTPKSDLIDSTV